VQHSLPESEATCALASTSPTGHMAWRGALVRVGLILSAAAKDLEAGGYDGLWVADQIMQEFDDHEPLEFWDSWTLYPTPVRHRRQRRHS